MVLLSSLDFQELEKWQYCVAGTTILDSYLQPWWNYALRFVPERTSPNVITTLGFLVTVLCTALVFIYSPTLAEQTPLWVHLTSAVCLFIYQTMDAVDGKQCRRTGRNSGIEEMFDHGCDSLCSTLYYLSTANALLLGSNTGVCLFTLLLGNLTFFSVHWRSFTTGYIFTDRIDMTEVQVSGMLLLLITSIYGSSVWQIKLFFHLTLADAIVVLTNVTGAFKILRNLRAIASHQKGSIRPMVTLVIGHSLIAFSYVINIDVIKQEKLLLVYLLLMGFFFAKQAQKIVLFHILNKGLSVYDVSLLPLLGLTVNSLATWGRGSPLVEVGLMIKITWFLSAAEVFLFIYRVTNEMAGYYGFKIYSLRDDERKFEEKQKEI